MSEQEDNGLTLEGLAQRLEALEHENASLRQQALSEAGEVSNFDEVRCNVLQAARLVKAEGGGVYGVNHEGEGVGVSGHGENTGVNASGHFGLLAAGQRSPRRTELSIGVWAVGDDIGVRGVGGMTGGQNIGVLGEPLSPHGTGVYGRVDGATGYAGRFEGGQAQLKLLPTSGLGAPTTNEHAKGELYMDSEAALFVCTADGRPGTWRKVTTTPT